MTIRDLTPARRTGMLRAHERACFPHVGECEGAPRGGARSRAGGKAARVARMATWPSGREAMT